MSAAGSEQHSGSTGVPARVVRLRVGGLTLSVRSRQPTTALKLPPDFQPFLVDRGGDITLDLSTDPLPAPPPGPPLFESGGVWSVYREQAGRLYLFATPALTPPAYKAVRIDDALTRGTLFFPRSTSDGPRDALDFPLDEIVIQHRLASDGALEVHACGVVIEGRAVLFLGQSGAGKSTLARLFRQREPAIPVLSDDRIVLRRRGRSLRAYGTPWHGDAGIASAASAPLGALFFIHHQAENGARRLAAREAASRLLARSFFPTWDPDVVGRVVETSAAFVSAIPCYQLGFRPDASAIDAVLQTLAGGRRR